MSEEKEVTDYAKIREAFHACGVDFRVLWGIGNKGVHVLLKGCVLGFDENLRFMGQQEISINEENEFGEEEEAEEEEEQEGEASK